MSDDLSLNFSIESDAAVAGVEKVNTALEGTATAAADAKPALSALDQAEQDLQTHLDKLANATGPRMLIREASQAQVALIEFKAAAQAAGMSMDEIAAKTQGASAAILDGATKSAQFTRALGELRAQGMLAANQLEGLRATGGNLSGMFQSMYKTGTDLEKGIGAIGIGAGIAGIAFAGAEALGQKLAKVIDTVAAKSQLLADTEAKGRNASLLYEAANRALDAGLIANSDSVAGLIKNYNDYILAQGRGSEAARQDALGFTDAQMAATSYAGVTAKAETTAAALTGQFRNQAAADEDLAKKTTALTMTQHGHDIALAAGVETYEDYANSETYARDAADTLVLAQAKATAEQFKSIQMMKEAEPQLKAVAAAYESIGEAVPVGIRLALDALEAMKKKNADVKTSMEDLLKVWNQLPAVMLKQEAEEKKLAAATQEVVDSHDKLIPAIDKILTTLAQETAAAQATGHGYEGVAVAQAKAEVALAAYAGETGKTIPQVMEMVKNQGGLVNALNFTNEEFAKRYLSQYSSDIALAAERTKDFVTQQKDLTAAAHAANVEFDKQAQSIKDRNAAIDAGARANVTMTTNLTLLQGAFVTVTAATNAQNKALEDLLKTQGAYTDALKQTLDIAKGWKDYLAGLADAYKTGAINLLQYKTALADFATELRQDFSGATGEARKAIDTMAQAIQRMIDTAGAGGGAPFDMSPTGQLNRAFNKP